MAELDPLLEKLEELIAATQAAAVPVEKRWGDAGAVGAALGYTRRHVLEELAPLPDFPKASRGPDGRAHPRWNIGECLDWMDRQRQRRRAA